MRELVKKTLKSCGVGRVIYPLAQKCYRLYAVPVKRARLQRQGVGTLKRVDEICQRHGIKYFADFGTLLGIVRENGFIKNDDDIDVSILDNEIDAISVLKVFRNEGFEFVHALTYHGKLREFTVSLNKLTVDFFFSERVGNEGRTHAIFYFDPKIGYKNPAENSVKERVLPYVADVERIDFNGVKIMIPANREEYLASLYGKKWRTPDPAFVTGTQDTYKLLPDYGIRITDENDL